MEKDLSSNRQVLGVYLIMCRKTWGVGNVSHTIKLYDFVFICVDDNISRPL